MTLHRLATLPHPFQSTHSHHRLLLYKHYLHYENSQQCSELFQVYIKDSQNIPESFPIHFTICFLSKSLHAVCSFLLFHTGFFFSHNLHQCKNLVDRPSSLSKSSLISSDNSTNLSLTIYLTNYAKKPCFFITLAVIFTPSQFIQWKRLLSSSSHHTTCKCLHISFPYPFNSCFTSTLHHLANHSIYFSNTLFLISLPPSSCPPLPNTHSPDL